MPVAPVVVVIAHPDHRRVTAFQRALSRAGLSPAVVVPWLDLARDPGVLDRLPLRPTIVRIESFGEDFEVEREFLRRGYPAVLSHPGHPAVVPPAQVASLVDAKGRVFAPRQAHLGFVAVLDDIAAWAATRPDVRVTTPPDVLCELFDKRLTSATFARLGVPIPPALPAASDDVDTLRDQLRGVSVSEVYVKVSCGSSASCLARWRIDGEQDVVLTTLEATRDGFYNSLRVRSYQRRDDVRRVLGFLLAEGAHVEVGIDKARLGGRHLDCRVLVIAGEPRFLVGRTSEHPITNLHLGGCRADLSALRRQCPDHVLDEVMTSCRRIGAHYPTLHVGIDVLLERGFAGHRVVEANAFGDLLPNLLQEGLDPYDWQVKAMMALPRPADLDTGRTLAVDGSPDRTTIRDVAT